MGTPARRSEPAPDVDIVSSLTRTVGGKTTAPSPGPGGHSEVDWDNEFKQHDVQHRVLTRTTRQEVRATTTDAKGIIALDAVEWDELARGAAVQNPFYSRQYMLAGLETLDARVGLRMLEFRAQSGRLVGLFPFVRRWGIAHSARNLYQFSGTPLIHKDFAEPVISAWLDVVASNRLAPVWHLTDFRLEGPLSDLVRRCALERGMLTAAVNSYNRPILDPMDGGLEQHLSTVLSKSRRKDLERLVRRLREQGELRFERVQNPDQVCARLEQFLEMERAGWKGQAGTAMLCDPPSAAFARRAFAGTFQRPGITAIDSLILDGHPIAISINITSGDLGFTPKCTYDEAYRKWSPGLVLEYFVIEQFYADPGFAAMDSATTVDGHVVEGLWNKAVAVGELFIGAQRPVRVAARVAAAHARAKSAAKMLLKRSAH